MKSTFPPLNIRLYPILKKYLTAQRNLLQAEECRSCAHSPAWDSAKGEGKDRGNSTDDAPVLFGLEDLGEVLVEQSISGVPEGGIFG